MRAHTAHTAQPLRRLRGGARCRALGGAFVAALVASAAIGPAGAQRAAAPPARQVTLGPIALELFGDGEIMRRADGVQLSWREVTASVARGPGTVVPPLPRAVRGVRERGTRACGVPARLRERIVRFEELTSWEADGSHDVARTPGPAEITLRFDWGGEHFAVTWRVSDHRQRARFRSLERRFFASVRCAPPDAPPAVAPP